MVDFKKFKKSSGDIDRLTKEIAKINAPQGKTFEEYVFWKPKLDKAGNAYVVMRFLPEPAVDGDDALAWVRLFSHNFKGPGDKYYIQNSLTTLGQKDPCGEYNSKLWKQGLEDAARKQKRQTHYFSNVLIIEEANAPENNGKTFPFRYGPRIFRKIEEAIDPWHDADGNEIPGTANLVSVNPFDFWKGSTFRLRVKTTRSGEKKYPNYDDSSFIKDQDGQVVTSALSTDDDYLEKLWKSLPSLRQYTAPEKFKTYDELKAKLYEVLQLDEEGEPLTVRAKVAKGTVKPTAAPTIEETYTETTVSNDDVPFDVDSDDDETSFFKDLANKS